MRIIPKIGINSKHMRLSGNFIGDQGVGNHKVCVNAMAYLQNKTIWVCYVTVILCKQQRQAQKRPEKEMAHS